MDDYRFLIGAAPTTEEQMKLLADSLRRRRAYGELGQLTGDRVLQPFGANLTRQADDYAKQVQTTRQMDADNAQTKWYQGQQIDHMGKVLKETMRGHDLQYALGMAGIAQRDRSDFLDMMKSGGDYKKLTDSTRNKMLDRANIMAGIKDAVTTFKPEYTQMLGPGPQSKLPNAMAGYGIGTKASKEAQLWWSNWEKFYTLPERNLTFGATLTPNEQQAWREVNIHPGMDADIITKKLNKFFETLSVETIRRIQSMNKEGFDPSVMNEMYADVLPPEMLLPENSSRGPLLRTDMTRQSTSQEEPVYTEQEIIQQLQELDERLNSSGR